MLDERRKVCVNHQAQLREHMECTKKQWDSKDSIPENVKQNLSYEDFIRIRELDM